jgi:hypothetical protein
VPHETSLCGSGVGSVVRDGLSVVDLVAVVDVREGRQQHHGQMRDLLRDVELLQQLEGERQLQAGADGHVRVGELFVEVVELQRLEPGRVPVVRRQRQHLRRHPAL